MVLSKTTFCCMVVCLALHLCHVSQGEEKVLDTLVKGLTGVFVILKDLEEVYVYNKDEENNEALVEIDARPVTVDFLQAEYPETQQHYAESFQEIGREWKLKETFIYTIRWNEEEEEISMTRYSPTYGMLSEMMLDWCRTSPDRFYNLRPDDLKLDEGCGVNWRQDAEEPRNFRGKSPSPCTDGEGRIRKYDISLRTGEGFNVTVLIQTGSGGPWTPTRTSHYKFVANDTDC